MNQFSDELVSLRSSIQRAMLGRIVPSMRAITAQVTPDARIAWVFLDGPATSEILDLLSEAETEILADYYDNKVSVQAITLPMPAMVPQDRGIWVYARYEPYPS